MIGNVLIVKLWAFLRAKNTRLATAVIRDVLFSYLLFLLSCSVQICGWHRIYLGVRGWWLFPLSIAAPVMALLTRHFDWVVPCAFPLVLLAFMDALLIPAWVVSKNKENRP